MTLILESTTAQVGPGHSRWATIPDLKARAPLAALAQRRRDNMGLPNIFDRDNQL